MKKEEGTVNFDLSALSLMELIKVYEEIVEFGQFLTDAKIDQGNDNTEGENE